METRSCFRVSRGHTLSSPPPHGLMENPCTCPALQAGRQYRMSWQAQRYFSEGTAIVVLFGYRALEEVNRQQSLPSVVHNSCGACATAPPPHRPHEKQKNENRGHCSLVEVDEASIGLGFPSDHTACKLANCLDSWLSTLHALERPNCSHRELHQLSNSLHIPHTPSNCF